MNIYGEMDCYDWMNILVLISFVVGFIFGLMFKEMFEDLKNWIKSKTGVKP